LAKIGRATAPGYLISICHFLKCVNVSDPAKLLDLKGYESIKRRFFPAEKLVETWQAKARKEGLADALIKRRLDAVRSFFKHNRIPLVQVTCAYKPKQKQPLTDEDIRRFREGFNWFGKILFDFLLSAPLRDGQFQHCPYCKRDFYPQWSHIRTYPNIHAYSPVIIKPQKGHENNKYPDGLMQVCYLTETAANGLNAYRDFKEKALGRKLSPEEPIFTHQKNIKGKRHITPIGQRDIICIFRNVRIKTGVNIYPHLLRTWANSILATRGIEKQLRDLYLGHVCAYDQGYVMQLLTKWQQTFMQAKAMEHLDPIGAVVTTEDLEAKLMKLEDQEKTIRKLREEIEAKTIGQEDLETLKLLAKMARNGEIAIKQKDKT